MDREETLIKVIKQQAEIFLLAAREFFPFGTCLGPNDEIIPIAAYIDKKDDRPQSQPLIEMLENSLKKGLANGDYIIGALAFDALINEKGRKYDAVIIRIFEKDNMIEKHFKYFIHEDRIDFI